MIKIELSEIQIDDLLFILDAAANDIELTNNIKNNAYDLGTEVLTQIGSLD